MPTKNTIDDFRGVKISENYDFSPNRNKYTEEPPKAGGNKGSKKPSKRNSATNQRSKKEVNDEGEEEEEEEDEESLDVDEIKKKVLKVTRMLNLERL